MNIENALYVLSSVLFILGIKRLSHPKTARSGNSIASLGMLIAIVTTLLAGGNISLELIAIGIIIGTVIGAFFAIRVEMTQMPQMVAIFNGFGSKGVSLIPYFAMNLADHICFGKKMSLEVNPIR